MKALKCVLSWTLTRGEQEIDGQLEVEIEPGEKRGPHCPGSGPSLGGMKFYAVRKEVKLTEAEENAIAEELLKRENPTYE
ncbi:MAG: hypothetical protein WC789_09215 [Lentisphaeria bacterium]